MPRPGLGCLLLPLPLLLLGVYAVFGTELTFELSDNDKQCFYEELDEDTKFDIDFQVSSCLLYKMLFKCKFLTSFGKTAVAALSNANGILINRFKRS